MIAVEHIIIRINDLESESGCMFLAMLPCDARAHLARVTTHIDTGPQKVNTPTIHTAPSRQLGQNNTTTHSTITLMQASNMDPKIWPFDIVNQ